MCHIELHHVQVNGHLVMWDSLHQVQLIQQQELVQIAHRVDIKVIMVNELIYVLLNGHPVMRDNMQMVHPLQHQVLVRGAHLVDISLQMVNG